MAAALRHHAADALRRGLLLLGVIAVVAGFLGMHIMAGMQGAHAMSAVAASAKSAVASAPADGIAAHSAAHAVHPGTAAPGAVASAPSETVDYAGAGNHTEPGPSASCVCQAGCTDPVSMHGACVPSAAVSSLAAPPPGAAPTSLHNPDARGSGAVPPYAYLPAGPSPGDLSISRT